MIPNLMNAAGLDTSDEYGKGISSGPQASGASATPITEQEIQHGMPDQARLLKLAMEAESQSITFFNTGVRANWSRSYKAFRNQHMEGSKYGAPEYRGRSKYFRPKTRIAVMKSMANVAQAMFGTGDVVAITPQNESDKGQEAAAALKQEILNYRLDRQSRRNGIRWFMTAMGAYQTAKITGLCISKQAWLYREDDPRAGVGADGEPPVMEDRPSIQLIAPENVLFDANCDWTNPAQSSQYVIVRYPMSVDEVENLIKQNINAGDAAFYDIERTRIQSCARATAPIDTTAARAAREGGKDPIMQASGAFARVWVNEVFMRVGNLDIVYWTIDNKIMLSRPVPVRKAYPAFAGERPVVIGYGNLEAFRPFPMSHVESWQQLQMETNDQTNLRLDHMKQVVAPKAKVVRGKKVDLTQVQRAGPHGIVLVNEPTDVEWWQPPDLPQSAFVENNYLTADFDSLAGVFDAGSVNNNRQLNETVGGMKLLAASTNPQSSFDIQVWVESWVEPVIWQLMKLEEYYENDQTVLLICGQKAQLWERFGIDQITDELLMRETNVTVKLGVGVNNLPQERLQQFSQAWGVAAQAIAPFIQAGIIAPPKPKIAEIVDTVFGAAGFKDGGARFFDGLEQQQEQPGPAGQPNPMQMAEAQSKMASVQIQAKKVEMDHQAKMAELEQRREEAIAKINLEYEKLRADMDKSEEDRRHDSAKQARDHVHDMHRARHEAEKAREGMEYQGKLKQDDRDHQTRSTAAQRVYEAEQAAAQRKAGGEPGNAPAPERQPQQQSAPRPADERHAAFMKAIQSLSQPISVKRGADGAVSGVQ